MTLRTSKQTIGTAALIATTLIMGGCGSVEETNRKIENSLLRHGNWEQLHKRYENRVEQVTIEHSVRFSEERSSLSRDERRRLVDFLRRSDIGRVDRVAIVGARQPDGNYDALTEARLGFVKIELDAFGIAVLDDGVGAPVDAASPDQVVIMVDRHIVVTPDCSQPQPAAGDRPIVATGCSDVANLGLMVADPRDLVRGRPIGPMDGEFAAKGVFDYRGAESKEGAEEIEDIISSTTGDQL